MPAERDDLDAKFMREAVGLAADHMRAGHGGPFGAVIVAEDRVVARGWNQVTSTNDPTAHAEVVAIRAAGAALQTFDLAGCVLYSSCEPCPMCLAAAYWARVDRLVFAGTRADAAAAGFDDELFYTELALPIAGRSLRTEQMLREEALRVFAEWQEMPGKIPY